MNRRFLIGLNLLICIGVLGFGLHEWLIPDLQSDTNFLPLAAGIALSFIGAIYWTLKYAKTSKTAQLAAKILVASFALLIFATGVGVVVVMIGLSTWN